MMKRFFIAASLMAMVSSCSENVITEVLPKSDNANLIGFETATAVTRGTTTATATLEASTVVVSYIDTTDSSAKEGTISFGYDSTADAWAQGTYVDDTGFSDAGSEMLWSALTLPAYFYSIHDGTQYTSGVSISTATTEKATVASYAPATAIKDQLDVVYFAQKITSQPSGSAISGTFKHALSHVEIYSNHGENYKPTYTSVVLKNTDPSGTPEIAIDGTITWTPSGTATTDYTYFDAAASTPLTLAAASAATMITAASAADATNNMLLVPQTLVATTDATSNDDSDITPNNTYIEVVYRMEDTSGSDIVGYANASDCPAYADNAGSIAADSPLYVKVAYILSSNLTLADGTAYDLYINAEGNGGVLIDNEYVDEDGTTTGIPIVTIVTGEEVIPAATDPIGIAVGISNWAVADAVTLPTTN